MKKSDGWREIYSLSGIAAMSHNFRNDALRDRIFHAADRSSQ
jgi:hypothetical protein